MNFKSIKERIINSLIFKYFRRNFKDSAFSISNLMIASLDGFFLNVLLVRFLSIEDLGNYKLFFSILNILIIFSINGLGTSVTKSVVKRYPIFFMKATKTRGLFSIIASLALIVLAFSYYSGSDIKMALIYASFIVPIYFGFNNWEAYLYGRKDFKKIFLLNALIGGTRFIVCAVILIFYKNYLFTILAYLLIVSFYNLIFFFWISKKVKYGEVDKSKEKDNIKHGFKLTGASAVSVIAKNVERIILDSVSSATMVGIYSIFNVFPNFIKNSLKTLVNVPTVKLAAKSEKENRRIIRKGLYVIFFSGLVIFGIFWFLTPLLLKFFFKVDDLEIIMYGRLLLIPIIFIPANFTIKYLCSYQGSGSSFFKLFTTLDITKLALLAIFIPLYKINGIIIALILAEFFSFIVLIIWFIRSNKQFGIK